jgi:arylsulfatase A-like enzyme
VHENFVLAGRFVTLAELLSAGGYATYGVTSNPWVTKKRGLAQGFDRFDAAFTNLDEREDKGAAQATEYAIDFLAGAARIDRPFFLFVNYLEAHLPYAPPDAGLDALGIAATSLARLEFSIERAEEIIAGVRPASDDERKLARTLYLSEIAYQDRQLGRLFAALGDHGLLDQTLIVITADHGEMLGGEGLMGHEFSLSDEVLRVPLVLRYPPRIEAGQTLTLPVSHLDIVPTVLDLLTQPEATEQLEGKSLLALRGLSRERSLIAEYSKPVTLLNGYWASKHPDFDTEAFAVSLRSLRKGSQKLVENSRGEVTLIDPTRDPQNKEADDLARRELVLEMREELAQWVARLSQIAAP